MLFFLCERDGTVICSYARTRMTQKSPLLRSLIADERRLMLEKSALEIMLKNVQTLRTKLKVDQVQLSSLVQTEMGQESSLPINSETRPAVQERLQPESGTEMDFDINNQPVLNLDVSSTQSRNYSKDVEEEEEDDEDEDFEDDVMCAMEVLGTQNEHDVDFENF